MVAGLVGLREELHLPAPVPAAGALQLARAALGGRGADPGRTAGRRVVEGHQLPVRERARQVDAGVLALRVPGGAGRGAGVEVAGQEQHHVVRPGARRGRDTVGHGPIALAGRRVFDQDDPHRPAVVGEAAQAVDEPEHGLAAAAVLGGAPPELAGEQRLPVGGRAAREPERGQERRLLVRDLERHGHRAPGGERPAGRVAHEGRHLPGAVELAEEQDGSGLEQRVEPVDGGAGERGVVRRREGPRPAGKPAGRASWTARRGASHTSSFDRPPASSPENGHGTPRLRRHPS